MAGVVAYNGPTLIEGQKVKKRFQPSDLTSSSLAAEMVPTPKAGFAVVIRRFRAVLYAAGAAFGSVGSNDNLVLRATDASGAILSQSITGVGFLDTSPTAFVGRVAAPANNQAVVAGAKVVLAYADSADGISATSVTGYLDVTVEYDLLYVGQ